MTKKYTAAALFSGIGGFCLGFERKSIRTKWAVEIDDRAVETYSRNIPSAQILTKDGSLLDVRNVEASTPGVESVDVLHAGFPCQSFSSAGNRKGFADERGRLFFELIRILRQFGEDRPKVVVLENSPFLKLGEGGAWFDTVATNLKKAGYWFRESNAVEMDLYDHSPSPQRRNRLFMVAFATNRFKNGRINFPTPLAAPATKSLEDYIDFWGTKDDRYYLPEQNRYYKMIESEDNGEKRIYQLRKYLVRVKEKDVCPTLTANMGQGGHNVPFIFDAKGLRKLTERECSLLQSFPEDFEFPETVPSHARYKQIGNSVAPIVAERIAMAISERLEDAIIYV